MPNHMPAERRVQLLRLLTEGNSVRLTARLMETNNKTVLRHLTLAGDKCRDFLDRTELRLSPRHVEIDEIRTFARKKEVHLTPEEKLNPELGDKYVFTALDQDSRLLVTYAIGKRNGETTGIFINDLASRLNVPDSVNAPWESKPQISTDG